MAQPHPDHPNLVITTHPLIEHKLTQIRDRNTPPPAFRALTAQVAGLMASELTRSVPTEPCTVETPIESTTSNRLAATITLVPVLRAGLGMAEGVGHLVPEARFGHIGLFRDEKTLLPIQYLSKLPDNLGTGPVILIDPMVATGGSASAALAMLRAAGARDLRVLSLIAVPESMHKLHDEHPDVTVYTAALDRQLNDQGFILPGLGDAGDRLFGTH